MSAEHKLGEMVADLVDDMVADLLARVEGGHVLTKEEATCTLLQLQRDRQRMRALIQRQGATIQ